MIEVVYDGGLGNQLFQYCFARILACKTGLRLDAPPIEGFPVTFATVPGRVNRGVAPLVLTGQIVDLDRTLEQAATRPIRVSGYFQRYEYYAAYAEVIRREWMRMDDAPEPAAKIAATDLALHVRRGDYVDRYPGAALPRSFYDDLLTRTEYGRLWLCTDDPEDRFVKELASHYGATIRSSSYLSDFRFLSRCPRIVLSQSTYSWWAAYLSSANEIFMPIPLSGYWSARYPEIDLRVPEERYVMVHCREPYRLSFGERLRFYRANPAKILRGISNQSTRLAAVIARRRARDR